MVKNYKRSWKSIGGLAVLSVLLGASVSQAQTARVELDGQPLATAVQPIIRNGTTLVPMRDIFEALGATVVWDGRTQEINAQKETTRIWLQIGNRNARVGDGQQWLSQAPILYEQSTLVPLRFVSESLGANVDWDGTQRLVSIRTADQDQTYARNPHSDRDRGDRDNRRPNRGEEVKASVTIPANAVVPVTLDETLSSATAREGDRFTATVKSEQNGDAEFPHGTKLEGTITEVQPKQENAPGVLGLEFRRALLPNGQTVRIEGYLISLDDDSTSQQSDGRIMAKSGSGGTDLKVVGIGAAAGFVVGKLLKRNELVTSILGAAGGYLYDRNRDKGKEREAVVEAGTTLGVHLSRSVTYNDTGDYWNRRRTYLQ